MNLFYMLNGLGSAGIQNPLLLGTALFNTYIGLSNNRKNTQQYQKQITLDAKFDKILSLLEAKEDSFNMYSELIKEIQKEIDTLVEKESKGLTTAGQNQLHLLLENRKGIIEMCEQGSEHINVIPASYFGGTM